MRYGDLDTLAVKWMLASPKQRKIFRQIIDKHPTEDVVPKSEVEKVVAQIAKQEMDSYEAIYKQEVAREIFEEIEKGFAEMYPMFSKVLIINFLAELKKKYTESEKVE